MGFDFDDNLSTTKRKNTNPARFTNLLIVAGFVMLAVLIVFLMNSQPTSTENQYTEANIEATVDARLSNYLNNQPTAQLQAQATTKAEVIPPVYDAPTLEPRPLIEGFSLVSNKMAEGTLTDESFAIDYTYEGQAGTPIVITMQGDTLSPALVLTHPSGERMISSIAVEQLISTESKQVIATILPTDGQYIITATRKGGRAGDSEGDFTLNVDIPKSLDTSSTITSTTSSNTWDWYTYESDSPFSVIYQHEDGTFKPEVHVYSLNLKSEFVSEGYLPNGQLSYGVIGYFDEDTTHFIAVGQPTINISNITEHNTGSYKIGIRVAQ